MNKERMRIITQNPSIILTISLIFLLLLYLYWVSFPQLAEFRDLHSRFSYIYPHVPMWKILLTSIAFFAFVGSLFRGFIKNTLILLCFFGISIYIINYNLGFMIINSDAWAYPAFVDNAWKLIPPPSLFVEEGLTDPHYGPNIVVLGILAKVGLDPKTLVLAVPFAVFPLLCFSIFLFVKELFDEKTGLIATIVSFFFWGSMAKGFHPYAVTEVWLFYYNSIFALSCFFLTLYFFVKSEKRTFILSIFFGFLCIASHLVYGAFLVLFILVLNFTQYRKTHMKKTFYLLPILLFLVILWPWNSIIGNFNFILNVYTNKLCQGVLMSLKDRIGILFNAAGIALCGLVGFFYLFREKSITIPILALLSFLCIVAPIPYNLRFIVPLMICLHIGWAIFLQKMRKKELIAITFIVVLILSISLIQRHGISGFLYRNDKIPPDLDFVTQYTEPDAVIVSDKVTEYLIRAQTYRKTVTVARYYKDTPSDEFFLAKTTNARRIELIQEYTIDYILINKNRTREEVINSLDTEFKRIYSSSDCILYLARS